MAGSVRGPSILGQGDARSVQEPHRLPMVNTDAFWPTLTHPYPLWSIFIMEKITSSMFYGTELEGLSKDVGRIKSLWGKCTIYCLWAFGIHLYLTLCLPPLYWRAEDKICIFQIPQQLGFWMYYDTRLEEMWKAGGSWRLSFCKSGSWHLSSGLYISLSQQLHESEAAMFIATDVWVVAVSS